ncbi:MAG: isoprenylcysteine carboxylmethyltransferase family protein [Pelolinea sp.]|nr:isoprenylcysteine carboxylmethyltransferase family protein [Pelolinea sp.]
MSTNQLSRGELIKMMALRLFFSVPVLMVMFFLPAGTFAYWQAWVYLAIILIPMLFVLFYFMKNNPKLLERRMKMREKESSQNLIVKFSTVFFLIAFILPGLDYRFGWSHVPLAIVVIAEIVVFLGYSVVFLVFKENSYASRVIEVEQGQKVISSGPYAIVRHPMYSGTVLMYILSPLALGSWWALIPALMIIPVIVARILNEENLLARDLPGYPEYMQKVRFRLIPGMW